MKPIFFFNDTATTEIYTLSLHDALPISRGGSSAAARVVRRACGRKRTAKNEILIRFTAAPNIAGIGVHDSYRHAVLEINVAGQSDHLAFLQAAEDFVVCGVGDAHTDFALFNVALPTPRALRKTTKTNLWPPSASTV